MADAIDIQDVEYSGEAAADFIALAVISNDTVQSGVAFVKDGIKKQFSIPRMDVTDIIQAKVATPNPETGSQGTVTVDSRKLIPEEFMVYFEFNPEDYYDHWLATQMNPELLDSALPVSAESAMLQIVLSRVGEWSETAIWTSVKNSATPYTYFDGLIEKLTSDPDTNLVANPVALTEENILAKLKLIKAAVPKALKKKKNLKYLIGVEDFEKYENALQGLTGLNAAQYQAGAEPRYSGKDMVVLAGIPENTILVCLASADMSSNIWIGLNSKADDSYIRMDRLQNNSKLWFIRIDMKMDVQIGWTQEATLYTV